MKKIFVILFSFLSASPLFSQLSGFVFLNGQNNHAGIKIKFISTGGTSVTDSTTTNASGAYTINISGGIYTVVFSKQNYQSEYYNNNAPLVLTNTTTLNSITLYPGNIINVSGNVSGNWTNNNIYLVNGNITIASGTTLDISPGTVVKFNGNYLLTAAGVLNATGTSSDKILFISNKNPAAAGDWTGLLIKNTNSTIKYCIIKNTNRAIDVLNASPVITDNEISNFFDIGVNLEKSTSTIKNNLIFDYKSTYYASGITTYNSDVVLECNTIYNGSGYGIRPYTKCIVRNNHIHHIDDPQRGYGINCNGGNSVTIEYNVIHDCFFGISVGSNVSPTPNPLITNNTLYSNTYAISNTEYYANAKISGNIITGNNYGITQSGNTSATPSEVSHNLLWNNSTNFSNVQILGLGQIVNTNSSGNGVDSYFNLYQDPLFVNNQPPFYTSNSPCMNAGSSLYSLNIGANSSGFCSGMVVGLSEKVSSGNLYCSPNPFQSTLQLHNICVENITQIVMHDISGKTATVRFENPGNETIILDTEKLCPGMYILEVKFRDASSKYTRLVKQ